MFFNNAEDAKQLQYFNQNSKAARLFSISFPLNGVETKSG
jgi:hypothetical protein